MGAYLDTPVTAKQSSHGTCRVGSRDVSYASTAVQGWRFSMEDAHVIVPDFDDSAALLAVFDGHGGKEVAEYCSRRMPKMLQSNLSYKSGDLSAALKELFMATDRKLLQKDVIQELKQYVAGGKEGDADMEVDSSDEREEARKLLEEADMPLDSLLAQYVTRTEGEGDDEDVETGQGGGGGRVRSVLEALASQVGFEIEFEDPSDSDDSEYDDDEDDGEGEGEGEEEGEREGEGEGEEEEEEERESEEKGEGEGKGHGEKERKGEGEEEVESKGEVDKYISKNEETKATDRNRSSSASVEVDSQEKKTENSERELTTQSTLDDYRTTAGKVDPSLSTVVGQENLSREGSEVTSTSHNLANNPSLRNSLETGLTSREQVLLPPPIVTSAEPTSKNEENAMQINGRDSDGKPLACIAEESGSTRVKNSSMCAKSSTTRAYDGSVDNNQSSKGHILLDLLTTSTTASNAASSSCKEPRGSRKRYREDSSNGTSKKNCRGILDEEGYHSGTTAVLCLLRENTLTVANAGDSRCVLSCRGVAVDMSEDHKPTDEPELSRIERAGGCVGADGRVNGGLNLSRAIGDHFYKENASLPLEEQMITAMPDVQSRCLQEDDEFIVVACDGIWNTKSSQEVVDFVKCRLSEGREQNNSPASLLEGICESLCDACLASDTDNDGTGCDNMTVAIALLNATSHHPSPSVLPTQNCL